METSDKIETPALVESIPAPSQPETAPIVDDEIEIDLFARVKLRTATIEAVESVPKSKKLYRIQLDVGELGKRQIAHILIVGTPDAI